MCVCVLTYITIMLHFLPKYQYEKYIYEITVESFFVTVTLFVFVTFLLFNNGLSSCCFFLRLSWLSQ